MIRQPRRAIIRILYSRQRIHQVQEDICGSLSHCWGKFQMKRLLQSTISSMVEGIDLTSFQKLSKNFPKRGSARSGFWHLDSSIYGLIPCALYRTQKKTGSKNQPRCNSSIRTRCTIYLLPLLPIAKRDALSTGIQCLPKPVE